MDRFGFALAIARSLLAELKGPAAQSIPLTGPTAEMDMAARVDRAINGVQTGAASVTLNGLPASSPAPTPEIAAPLQETAQATAQVTALQTQVGGSHYQMPIQHAEFCQRNKLTWCESAAIKYLVRHRSKNKLQDVLKAKHYIEILLDLEYPGWRNDNA
jgi:hypothetical protein